MKKLLLVMLVPVLVLGVMGCGGFDDSVAVDSMLQGVWVSDEAVGDQLAFVLSASQITIFKADYDVEFGTIALGVEFSGFNDALEGVLTYIRLDDGAELGSSDIKFNRGLNVGANTISIVETVSEFTYQNYMLPPKGTYSRLQ